MFDRPASTYDVQPAVLEGILRDDANPLNRICKLIPDEDNVKVLDIGAGSGLLACVFRKTHGRIIIDGMEPDPYAANLSRKYYRKFYSGHAQDFTDVIRNEAYDFIVLADVIEHIADPLGFLQKLCAAIPQHTRIVLSVPNVAFGAVRIALLNGNFDYVDSGLLEKTHLRFFTLKTIETLIARVGMNIEKRFFLQRNMFSTETRLNDKDLNMLCLRKILKDELAWTYQFLYSITKQQVTTEQAYFGGESRQSLFRHVLQRLKIRIEKF